MATRAIVHVEDTVGNITSSIYKHYDGYVTGIGAILVEAIKDRAHAECAKLVPAIIAALWAENNGDDVYVYAPGTGDIGEEYRYTIGRDHVIVHERHYPIHGGTAWREVYNGDVAGFVEFVNKEVAEAEARIAKYRADNPGVSL